VSVSFVISIRQSLRSFAWNNSVSNRRVFINFYIWVFFSKSVEKIQVSLKYDKNSGTLREDQHL